jgi:hypothetical protein
MEEKKEVKEAEVVVDKGESEYEKKKIDFRFELALFLILGFLLGVVIKTEAVKRITIGFNDGQIMAQKQEYDFDKITKDISDQNAAQEESVPQNQDSTGNQGTSDQPASQENNQ